MLSVGRVQTPLLGLVVRRDQEIENFQSKPFYEVLAHLTTNDNECFTAKWKPSEACVPYQDEEGRVLSKKLAENVVSRITGQPANVDKVSSKEKKTSTAFVIQPFFFADRLFKTFCHECSRRVCRHVKAYMRSIN